MNEFDDDLAAALACYPDGILPGLHPIELISAALQGFEPDHARMALGSDEALGLLTDHWLRNPPTRALVRGTSTSADAAELNRALALATGRSDAAPLDLFDWVGLAVAKGAGGGDQTEMRFRDSLSDSTILVVVGNDQADISFVPEQTAGRCRLFVKWAADEVTSKLVQVIALEAVRIQMAAPSDGATPVAVRLVALEDSAR